MNKTKFLAIIFMLTLLGACVSSGGKEDSSSGSDLSGHVSSVLKFFNPLNTAHASDSRVCVPVPGNGGNGKVRIYTINPLDGFKTFACSTHLANDNSFSATIFDDNIPSGHHLKVEADLGGVIREAVVNSNDKDKKYILVDPISTITSPVALDMLKSDDSAKPELIRQPVKSFVESFGVDLTSIPPQNVAKLKLIFENNLSLTSNCLFTEDDPKKTQFGVFLFNRIEDTKLTVGGDGQPDASAQSYIKFGD